MGRPKSNHVQINISIPITFLDLMRRDIQEKYQLGEKNE